ncbi:MAG TPA: YegS/Rv2252/BmrU family lipid kinase [Actinophytocola sp.]|uniref:YegS/Rv2252/BmrU family lipid kinase n=1 Tax=Actinophytocola sp. TaxID=1872138 RepID=UPI002DB7B6F0|nr:YegS/Rv2252/BmrU family lipid kinase [Actinophytocola sp.]HEU5474835.1 YegS/Rv2252/BmrU family lipid kinase [Actinophytocola sp.]
MGIRAALAVHGGSGHGAGGRHAAEVTARLRAAVDHLEVIEASTAEDSQARMAAARDRGLDVLVVLGGDGSVHLGLQVCAGTETALGVIPAGTGNDLVRALGAPMSTLPATDALVSALREGRRRRLDLGRIDGSRWFATVLCAGFDSLVNERANRMRWPHGPRRYDLAIIAELAALRPYPLVVETTGERLELEAVMVSVGNTPTYGGGIPICPEADTADGLFDVTVIGKAGRLELIRMIPTVRRGRHVGHPVVTTLRAKRVRIGDDNGWIAYADGDRMGPLPMEITCEPGAVTVVG